MKIIIKKLMLLIIMVLASGNVVFNQTKSELTQEKLESPYDVINLKFVLEGAPTPDSVGFDNPKSYWQFSYKLQFLGDMFKFQYLGKIENIKQEDKSKRIEKNNKEYNKAWKKNSILVIKGKVPKTSLLSSTNREIIIPIKLSAEIKDILAKAGATLQNPEFRISVKGKISTQTQSQLKFKQKISPSFSCPTKLIKTDAQYWMMNTCGISIELKKGNDKINFGYISVVNN